MVTQIRNLYHPIQPTVKASAENVTYVEFLPDIRLQPYIYCYWQLKTTQPLPEPFNYRVVTDSCIDIILDLNNPEENYVMGFFKKFSEFPLTTSFSYIGIRFLPTMFPQFFKVKASELSNQIEHLSSIVPHLSDFISNRFNEKKSAEEVRIILDNHLLALYAKAQFNADNRLYAGIEIILKNNGSVEVQKDLNTGISPRQLRRLFEFYIGDTAKTFSKVVRFQKFLNAQPSMQSLTKKKLFFEAGYYDQSHFIKDFKDFYGITPGKAFENTPENCPNRLFFT
ncbi:AraC family transcriptional regulator [Sphingobacterium gobiense]|uniref:AraC family transcriptional regulator n=1 Tax=Sphingobacterium gobiense TaxID=1382456 RepID=A0A2S9JVZ4_9SPHI|nr:AraC family transcriptional regulator [Sphingobacterium gobiense]